MHSCVGTNPHSHSLHAHKTPRDTRAQHHFPGASHYEEAGGHSHTALGRPRRQLAGLVHTLAVDVSKAMSPYDCSLPMENWLFYQQDSCQSFLPVTFWLVWISALVLVQEARCPERNKEKYQVKICPNFICYILIFFSKIDL